MYTYIRAMSGGGRTRGYMPRVQILKGRKDKKIPYLNKMYEYYSTNIFQYNQYFIF